MESKRKRNAILAGLLALAIVLSNFLVLPQQANAATNITVLLDGRQLAFEVPPQNINSRVMVPFRAIGEAMGATVGWDDATKRVTMYLYNKYVFFYVGTGNNIMTYGNFTTDSLGQVTPTTTNYFTFDSPPVIVESRTLVSTRAIAEGLGATVGWVDSSKTVLITSPVKPTPAVTPTPTPSPTPSTSPTPSPTPTALFDNTNYYEEISARRAQSMYDNDEQFILVYYSNKDQESIDYFPMIKQAAYNIGYKIYGVDADSSNFDNSGNRLTFIWDYIRKNSTSSYPTVFFVHGMDDVETFVKPRNRLLLESEMDDFWYDTSYRTPTPTPRTTSRPGTTATPRPTASPRPTPSPTPNLGAYWIDITRDQAQNKYERYDKFILVYYYKGDTDSDRMLDTIKTASYNARVDVYAANVAGLNENANWFGRDYLDSYIKYPVVFFVESNGNVTTQVQPTNLRYLEDDFYDFMR